MSRLWRRRRGDHLREHQPDCGALHNHYDRLIWTDLPGRLCVCILPEDDRPRWAQLENEAFAALSVPLRGEGPPAVRLWGDQVRIREQLRRHVYRIVGVVARVC